MTWEKSDIEDVFQAIPLPSYVFQRIDDSYHLINYNIMANEVTNGRTERLVNRPAKELYPEMPYFLEDIHNCYSSKKILRREVDYTSPTSGINVFLINTFSFVAPDKVCMYTVDVSEMKKQERELKRSKDKIFNILKSISDAIFVADMLGNIISANSVAEKMFLRSSSAMEEKHLIDLIPEMNGQSCKKSKINDWVTWNDQREGVAIRNNGQKFPIEVTSNIYQGKDGQKISLFVRDITERKFTEDAKIELQKLSTVNKIAITIAHEFNNPLAIIKGIVDLAEYTDIDDNQKKEIIEKTDKQIERMRSLVDKFLNLQRLNEKKYAGGTEFFDIHGNSSNNTEDES